MTQNFVESTLIVRLMLRKSIFFIQETDKEAIESKYVFSSAFYCLF